MATTANDWRAWDVEEPKAHQFKVGQVVRFREDLVKWNQQFLKHMRGKHLKISGITPQFIGTKWDGLQFDQIIYYTDGRAYRPEGLWECRFELSECPDPERRASPSC